MTYFEGEQNVQRRKYESQAQADRYMHEKLPKSRKGPGLSGLLASILSLFTLAHGSDKPETAGKQQDSNKQRSGKKRPRPT